MRYSIRAPGHATRASTTFGVELDGMARGHSGDVRARTGGSGASVARHPATPKRSATNAAASHQRWILFVITVLRLSATERDGLAPQRSRVARRW